VFLNCNSGDHIFWKYGVEKCLCGAPPLSFECKNPQFSSNEMLNRTGSFNYYRDQRPTTPRTVKAAENDDNRDRIEVQRVSQSMYMSTST